VHIYIPTKGRGPTKQLTYDKIKHSLGGKFVMSLVCPPEELGAFVEAGYRAIPCSAQRIGATRQWIIEHADDVKVLMLDDDLNQWSVRPDREEGRYVMASRENIFHGLQELSWLLVDYAHAGIGARLYSNMQAPLVANGRITRAWGLRADVLLEHKLKFTCPVDDLEMTIQLLRAGYANMVMYALVQDQGISQAPGGASTYRTLEYHNACHEQINRWHPAYTRLVEKTTKGGWFDGKPRKEVVISWAKLVKDFQPTTIGENQARQPGNPRTRDE
jgi:hypothetical protein